MARQSPATKLLSLVKATYLLAATSAAVFLFGLVLLFPAQISDVLHISKKDRKLNVDLVLRLLAVSYLSFATLLYRSWKIIDPKARRALMYACLFLTFGSSMMLLRKQMSSFGIIAFLSFLVAILLGCGFGIFVFVVPDKASFASKQEARFERLQSQLDQVSLERDATQRQLEDQKTRIAQLLKQNDQERRRVEELKKRQVSAPVITKTQVTHVEKNAKEVDGLRLQVSRMEEELVALRQLRPKDTGPSKEGPVTDAAILEKKFQMEAVKKKERKDQERKALEEKLKAKKKKEDEDLAKILG